MSDDYGQGKAQDDIIVIEEVKNLPFVDTHMHIQSNDIAPIPIMLGMTYFTGAKTARPKNKINIYELSFREIMHSFPSKADKEKKEKKNLPTKEEMDKISFASGESILGNIVMVFGGSDRERITETTTTLLVQLAIKDYGKIARHSSFNIAGVYMNELLKNKMGIASKRKITETNEDSKKNIKKSENEREELIEERGKTLKNYQRIISGYYEGDRTNIRGGFEFSVVLGMELMYAHYWGAYGIPIYLYINNNLYYISNDLKYITYEKNNDTVTWTCHTAYDMPINLLKENYLINGVTHERYNPQNNKKFFDNKPAVIGTDPDSEEKYKHYLIKTKEDEAVQYEDFNTHLDHTRMAAVKFPFSLLPFYHFDPRRFFSPEVASKLHEFYIIDKDNTRENKLTPIEVKDINGAIKNNEQFKNMKMDIDDLYKELLLGKNGTGLFWGIKMYAALGYPPYLYNREERIKIFPRLDGDTPYDGSDKGLLKFYKYCADNEIPVICHASPHGMTIADPGVYFKEYIKRQGNNELKVDYPVGSEQYIQGLGLIDDFSSPMSWKIVLKELKECNLKHEFRLCLAHYGGKGFFTDEYDEGSPYCWHKEIGRLIKDYDQVYTDLANYTVKNVPDILPEIDQVEFEKYKEKFPVVEKIYCKYDSKSYTYMVKINFPQLNDDEKAQLLALRLEMIERNKKLYLYKDVYNIVENLTKDLKDNEKLRYRMMFGTDWPMSEMDVTGVTNYAASMFVILQLVTKLMKGKWDAWHQFTVINPLRFLGLLEDAGKEEEGFIKFKFNNIDMFNKHLVNYWEYINNNYSSEDKEKYNLNEEECTKKIQEKYDELVRNYGKHGIPTASSKYMKKDDRLKILGKIPEAENNI
jgi:predicted TIM-barrel fold metal-dependent hydrolase